MAPEGSKYDEWLKPGRFALLLLALLFAAFPRVWLGTETFFARDYAAFTYPLAVFHKEAFWRGELPLWNPYNNCGLPFLAQWNSLTLYPGSLFYLLFPLPWSLGVFCLLHLFWGGLGMYFLAHRWTGNRLAAAIAGVAFAFNGLSWYALMWTNNTAALGWLPWVVLSVDQAWREGGRAIVLAALCGAMQMLAGAPEVILQTWILAGLLWLVAFFQSEATTLEAGSTATEKPVGSSRFSKFRRLAFVVALVAGLASVQLLPFLDLVRHSQRDSRFGDTQWSMPGSGWANYLVPLFHMQPTPWGADSQPGQYWTASYYVGIGTVALALFALWRVQKNYVWLLSAIAIISVLVAMGENGVIYNVIRSLVPQLGFLRFPIKFVVLATFALPLLAAFGAARWLEADAKDLIQEKRPWLCIGAGVMILIAAIGVWSWIQPAPPVHPAVICDMPATLWNAAERGALLALIFGALLGLRSVEAERTRQLLMLAIPLLFWLDLYSHAPRLAPSVISGVYSPDRIRDYSRWGDALRPGNSRAMPTPTAVLKMEFAALGDAQDDFNGRRLALFADYNVLDHAAKVDGFYSLYLREANAVNTWMYTVTNGLEPLKDFLGVSLQSRATNAADWESRPHFMPFLTIGQEPVFASDSESYRGIIADSFDPRHTVYLPPEARGYTHANLEPAARITQSRVTAHQIEARSETPKPALVVVSQAFYHNWVARVDGQPTPLWRANYAYQAFEVPPGNHRVELVYQDRALRIGMIISFGALFACILLWWRARPLTPATFQI